MSRPLVVLRPDPGGRVTAAAIEARGRRAIRLPLFEVVARPWTPPDPAQFDALVLTSANALRHAGPGASALKALPVYAVGEATADAARRGGFSVTHVGSAGAAALIAAAERHGVRRALHLAGRDRHLDSGGIVAAVYVTYASEACDVAAGALAPLSNSVALLHSVRAARRLAALCDDLGISRAAVRLATLSDAIAAAAGTGWAGVAVAARTDDPALIDAALAIAD